MSKLRPFEIKPGSPDAAIKAGAYKESALARIAHINRLSRDVNDIKYYEVDINESTTIRITSKKGIVDVLNADAGETSYYFYLQNSDITDDHDLYYLQLSVYSSNSSVAPIIIGKGFSEDLFQLEVRNIDAAADWGLFYFYYEIVRID